MPIRSLLSAILPLFLIHSLSFAATPLKIANETHEDIINILVKPLARGGKDFFLRLDLAPGHKGEVENPACEADLRVDTGLKFLNFANVPLERAKSLDFCGSHENCLAIAGTNGESIHLSGKVQSLVPAPGEKPVCELETFHPAMPMSEVCSILAPDTPRDDNGAVMAGLGFAGMSWAARLAPAPGARGEAPLEHLELRREFSEKNLKTVLEALFRKGYLPWQAEFPGRDIDFEDMPDNGAEARKAALAGALEEFLKKLANSRPQALTEKEETDDDASILMAPADILPNLANADEPAADVQLFTIVLRPRSNTLLVDVSAYRGEKSDSATR